MILRVSKVFVVLGLLVSAGCGSQKNEEPSSNKEPVVENETKPTPADTRPSIIGGATTTTPPTDEQIRLFVERCVAEGDSGEVCACLGDQAKGTLSGELVEKLANQPNEDDPKMKKYFTVQEMSEVMAYLEGATVPCKLDQEVAQ